MKKLYLFLAAILLLSGCRDGKIAGTWLQPVPGMEGRYQGFTLYDDGSAVSVNMNTLVYAAWEKNGSVLKLSGKSIGNGLTLDFSEEYNIKKLGRHDLWLENEGLVSEYFRKD